jgi:hypothetical protein
VMVHARGQASFYFGKSARGRLNCYKKQRSAMPFSLAGVRILS